jgi:hypothetical protein
MIAEFIGFWLMLLFILWIVSGGYETLNKGE